MSNSIFYTHVYNSIKNEADRISEFTNSLDRDPTAKKERIAEYKCAKYRYAAITNIHTMLFHCNRLKDKLGNSHYLLAPIDELLRNRTDLLALCDKAPENEKSDYGLYYGMIAFADEKIREIKEKLPPSSDWEKVELEERLDGYLFTKGCLDNAWHTREETGK